MRFKTVRIIPIGESWNVKFDVTEDIPNVKSVPNELGFYYYSENMGDEEAFNRLKEAMIFAHIKYLGELKLALDKLKALDYKNLLTT